MKNYIKSTLTLTAAAFGLIFLSGCSTITRGTTEALVIDSEPSNAEVRLSNGMSGTTPTSFKLKRKDAVVVTIKKMDMKLQLSKLTHRLPPLAQLEWPVTSFVVVSSA